MPYRILLVEDDPDDAYIIQKLLADAEVPFVATVVDEEKEYTEALRSQDYDVILCDHRLQQFNSLEALKIRNELRKTCPFILITGQVSEDLAVQIIREGGSDFILKDRLQRLPYAIRDSVDKARQSVRQAQIEQSLKKSNERFENAARASFDVIFDYELSSGHLYCSEAFTQIFGYPSGEGLDAGSLLTRIHPEDYEKVKNSFSEFLKEHKTHWHGLFRMLRKDGSVAMVNSSAVLVFRGEESVRVVGVLNDYTVMARLQNTILQKELDQQRVIAATTIKAQEKERREIGKELHDNVNQLLATAKLLVESYVNSNDIKNELMDKTLEVLIRAIAETRNISHAMMPPSFEADSFATAIRELAESINISGGIQIALQMPDTAQLHRLSNEMKLAVYRIIQEQLTNILKYARAESGAITLSVEDNFCKLLVADNGKGFDVATRQRGIGFSNIENRARLFNGRMEIISAPDQGCRLEVMMPLMPY
ncbi:MAG: PAS domain-containing protein [Flavisolibacter sp.]